jgi:glucokinase
VTTLVGIDAGGTKLAAGRVDVETGSVTDRTERPTDAGRGGAAVLADIAALARALGTDAAAVGIGIPEMVDGDGQVRSAANWDWRALDLATPFEGLPPARIVSDVHAAALAEARFGAGRSLTSFLYVSVGTGISSSFVLGGSPWPGHDGRAILLGAPLVEDHASGPAIADAAGKSTAEAAFADPSSDAVIEHAADALGLEVARAAHLLDPAAVVLGGGLGLNDRYRALVAAAIERYVDRTYANLPEVLPAELGENAGIVGAALSAC